MSIAETKDLNCGGAVPTRNTSAYFRTKSARESRVRRRLLPPEEEHIGVVWIRALPLEGSTTSLQETALPGLCRQGFHSCGALAA
jgi:hypothetical protein